MPRFSVSFALLSPAKRSDEAIVIVSVILLQLLLNSTSSATQKLSSAMLPGIGARHSLLTFADEPTDRKTDIDREIFALCERETEKEFACMDGKELEVRQERGKQASREAIQL